MTERQRATPPANAARIAVAGVIIAAGALAMAGPAGADPAVPYPTPAPSGPGAAAPAPGQPVPVALRMHPWVRPRLHPSARHRCQRSRTPFTARVNMGRARSRASGIFGTRPRTRTD